MSIITLTTDFGIKDHFVGATKGKILSEFVEATIIDISHEINKFNTIEASYSISAAYNAFPKGTVHIISVNSERFTNGQHLAMEWDGHFFICADNGILSVLTQKKVPQKIVSISIHDRLNKEATDIDVFVAAACHILRGGHLNVIGKEIETINTLTELTPQISEDGKILRGNIIYVDDFGNCVTNISKKQFEDVGRGRSFTIPFSSRNKINRINKFYGDFSNLNDINDGKALAVFNENGLLEIAIYKSDNKNVGSANSLLGLGYRDTITINFE